MTVTDKLLKRNRAKMTSLESLSEEDYNVHFFENNPKNPLYLALRKGIIGLGMTLIKAEQKRAKELGIDSGLVAEYDIQGFKEEHNAEYYDNLLLERFMFVVVSDKANKQARALGMLIGNSFDGKHAGIMVNWIVVSEKFQGEGYSKVLFESIHHVAKERGYNYLNLGVMANNENAKKAYEREGFKPAYIDMYCDVK